MFKIALGAGHGLTTPGKRCMKKLDPKETSEWWLNDRICDYVETYLKAYNGYQLLRLDDSDDGRDDIALATRVSKANAWGADFYLSVHHNAGVNGGKGGGICSFCYTKGSASSFKWRDAMYDALIDYTGLVGNRAQPKTTANFYVLRCTNMPAVLLELGFMDSATDVPIILTDTFAQKCAKAITEVLVERGGLTKKKTAATKTETTKKEPTKTDGSFMVRVTRDDLNIRKGPGYKTYEIVGTCPVGAYTITETKEAEGFTWGRLKSKKGWIALEYTERI